LSDLARFRALTKELESLRTAFGAEPTARKAALLSELAKIRWPQNTSAKAWVLRLHEALLFVAAHPDNAETAELANRALAQFADRLSRSLRNALEDSGVLGTEVTYPFDFPIVAWLTERYPAETRIGWKRIDDQEKLQSLLQSLTGPAEELGIDDDETTLEEWLKRAAGSGTDLGWLTSRLASLHLHPRLRDHLFDPVGIQASWRIRDPQSSRTLGRVARERLFFHTNPLTRVPPDLKKWIRRPVKGGRLCGAAEARALTDLAKSALSAREREMFPISHADERAVRVFPLERGLEIVTIGTRPERRLLLEGLWGYLFLKNGWPIGYGCFSAVFGSAEVAFNIFDSFRNGESALTYAQLLRVIHALTGATSYSVMKYQFGDDNAEAIKSGAFWFYDKLGFGHLDPEIKRLADGERTAKAEARGYRTSPSTLKKLATQNLYFHLGKETRNVLGELRFPEMSLAITGSIGERLGATPGGRESAIKAARSRVGRATGTTISAKGYSGEIAGEFCLFLNLFNLETWNAADRRAAGELVKARAGADEADFVTRLARHSRLKSETLRLLKRR
jgi:hypothetical protein